MFAALLCPLHLLSAYFLHHWPGSLVQHCLFSQLAKMRAATAVDDPSLCLSSCISSTSKGVSHPTLAKYFKSLNPSSFSSSFLKLFNHQSQSVLMKPNGSFNLLAMTIYHQGIFTLKIYIYFFFLTFVLVVSPSAVKTGRTHVVSKYEPSSGYLVVNLHSLLLFTSSSSSILFNSRKYLCVEYQAWAWLAVCSPVALLRFRQDALHPNRNLIQRRMKLFLHHRLCATCFANISESCWAPSSFIEQLETEGDGSFQTG